MLLDSSESTSPRRSTGRSARWLVAGALVGATVLALAVSVSFSRHRADPAIASASGTAAGSEIARPEQGDGRSVPSPFGYLEFDWDRGVPGFDPWPAEGGRP
jgi:hypothetical protein